MFSPKCKHGTLEYQLKTKDQHTAQKIIQRIHTGIAKTKKKASDDMYAPIDSPISSLPKKARPNLEPIQSSWNESMPAQ